MISDTASLWAAAKKFEGIIRRDVNAYSFAPLTDIYRQLGLLEDALDAARKGCAIHPHFAAGQMALARTALECALKPEAIKALEAVVRITPENIEAQRLLAQLYTADGNNEGALRCLAVASSLDTELQEMIAPEPAFTDETVEEEILEADILELSDDLIEDDGFDEHSEDPFAALPDRPSLGEDFCRAEPFLMETAPPISHDDSLPEAPAPTMASATIAELYVTQGFHARGIEVYRELIAADPLNELYRKRLMELTQSAEQQLQQKSVAPEGLLEKLTEWLGNIGRVRECRTRNL